MLGRHAEARIASMLRSSLVKRRRRPLTAWVAARWIAGALRSVRSRSMSMCRVSMSRSGSSPSGLRCAGETASDRDSAVLATKLRLGCSGLPVIMRSSGESAPTSRHTAARVSRAASGPPVTSPEARATALTAPALVPVTASRSKRSASRRRSRTPQVKAPCDPPPCSARPSGARSPWRRRTRFGVLGKSITTSTVARSRAYP